MLQWIKDSRVIYGFVSLLLGCAFTVGAYSATIVKPRDFKMEQEARAALESRVSVREEHDRQADVTATDLGRRLGRMEELLIGIAMQVGAPTKVGK